MNDTARLKVKARSVAGLELAVMKQLATAGKLVEGTTAVSIRVWDSDLDKYVQVLALDSQVCHCRHKEMINPV